MIDDISVLTGEGIVFIPPFTDEFPAMIEEDQKLSSYAGE
jgi:hypothetical protein